MPIKKRISKSKLRPNITVKGIDYKLKKDGAGFFMTDDVAEAFGRHALITYCDLKELLEA